MVRVRTALFQLFGVTMKNNLRSIGRSLLFPRPAVALVLTACLCSVVAQCSTVDFSSDITSMAHQGWVLGLYVAAVVAGLAVAFGVFKLVGRDWVAGLVSLGLGIVALAIIGHVTGWTSSLTSVAP